MYEMLYRYCFSYHKAEERIETDDRDMYVFTYQTFVANFIFGGSNG